MQTVNLVRSHGFRQASARSLHACPAALALSALLAVFLSPAAVAQYENGGPLAGLKLPPRPTQHGEQPGYPGCVPELMQGGKEIPDGGATYREFGPQGLAPELDLYPGSVEHWRAYWFKYCPVRSAFDRQSLVQNFTAPAIPGAGDRHAAEYAEPVYWVPRHSPIADTGRRNAPVPVVRCTGGDPVFTLDFGELDIGLYAVRVIGAVETESLREFLLPLYMRLKVNDRAGGGWSEYRMRSPYNDQFYSVAEIYFHAPEKRAYRAELSVDSGSQVALLVHNVTLDDALAGCRRERIKTRRTLADPSEVRDVYSEGYFGKRQPLDPDVRLARDAAIWHAFVPLNKHGNDDWSFNDRRIAQGAGGKPLAEIRETHGKWESVNLGQGGSGRESHAGILPADLAHAGVLMTNEKLGLAYTVEDLAANRPLPDPYPYKDDGAGLFEPHPDEPGNGLVFCPAAWAVRDRLQKWNHWVGGGAQCALAGRENEDYARDAAVALARFAYSFPTLDLYHSMSFVSVDPAARGRYILRRRMTMASYWGNFIRFLQPVRHYDALFDYIDGNQALAHSIGRFVPWVRTPDDVLELIDVYLVQTMAKRMMRYQYYGDGRQPERMAELATLVGNNDVTDPWMEWLFSRTFFYPNPPSGLQDVMITGTDRDGRSPIGSYSYMVGEFSADKVAQKIEAYIEKGGNPRFDLRDNRRYPKTLVSLDFYSRIFTAGLQFPRIGDVGGPDKGYAKAFETGVTWAEPGWRWTRDPKFAWILKHFGGSTDPEIEKAAATVDRAPWMDNRSRVMPGWGAFLESGCEHDDFRFRRSAMLRIGTGYGHGHSDTLDLQLYAHGLPMTCDAGQRGGYSEPGDRDSRVHNTVVVDGKSWMGHSWAQVLTDAPGAGYVRVQAAPLHGTRLFRRQLALVDVDEGRGSLRPLTPEQVGPQPKGLPTDVTTPNSYVFDVFRVAGGATHTYCFHATVNDTNGPQPVANALNVEPLPEEGPATPLRTRALAFGGDLRGTRYCGTVPEKLEATFRLQKHRLAPAEIKEAGAEVFYMPRDVFDPESPDKLTRLHLFNAEGGLFLKGDLHCHRWGYYIPNVYAQRTGENLESAFGAVIEPYAGEPFLSEVSALAVADNEDDARRAVALRVVTANGHTDVCFADGRPAALRAIESAGMRVSGEFAFASRDAQGLRLCTLTGGTQLELPEARLRLEQAERTGTITRVDYFAKKIWIDRPWPGFASGAAATKVLEIGDVAGGGAGGYVTGYTAAGANTQGDVTEIALLRGADSYRSRIKSIDPDGGTVVCVLNAPSTAGPSQGIDRNFTASNEDLSRFWRADVLPGDRSNSEYPFRLSGGPVDEQAFAPQGALRLWEYGEGDSVRHSTFAQLRRAEPDGAFELTADTGVTLALQGAGIDSSADGQTWEALPGKAEDGWYAVEIPVNKAQAGVMLRARQ